MSHGNHQIYVAHAFAAHFFLGYFDSATVAHYTFITNTLVFSAGAFVVLYRAEYAFAEKTVAFGFVGAVVYGFRFQDFSRGLMQDYFRRGQSYGDFSETVVCFVVFT